MKWAVTGEWSEVGKPTVLACMARPVRVLEGFRAWDSWADPYGLSFKVGPPPKRAVPIWLPFTPNPKSTSQL